MNPTHAMNHLQSCCNSKTKKGQIFILDQRSELCSVIKKDRDLCFKLLTLARAGKFQSLSTQNRRL